MSTTRSMSARVVVATTVASALAGVAVAVVGIELDEVFSLRREDARLLEAATTLAVELDEDEAEPAIVVDDETRELAGTGIVVAFFDGAARLSGDERLDRPAIGGCHAHGEMRSCAVATSRGLTAVAGRPTAADAERRSVLRIALGIAVALATLVSAFGGYLAARWSLRPLHLLTRRVAAIDVDAPTSASLEAPVGVAEVDALRAALARTIDRLGLALDQARRFAGNAAHELRTPLTTIRGELELVAERLTDPAHAEPVERTRRTVERISRLVERLLVLARPVGDAATEPVDVGDLVEDLVAELPPSVAGRVTIEIEPRPRPVRGDATLLGAMVSAGLENALKFSEGPVVVRAVDVGSMLHVEIDDEGPGVPEADRRRVFGAFERASTTSTGSGIGLALVDHVVALHRGRARFVDGARGARLRMELPSPT